MTLNTTTTVREIALERPEATRIFEKLGIDYCCGGAKSLAESCAAAGVETNEILRLLEGAAQANEQDNAHAFLSGSLAELTGYIVDKHHTFTRDELARLDALLAKVCSVHGRNHAELLRLLMSMMRFVFLAKMYLASRPEGK